jgi:ubiquinone/menaquinone biosynthesis C-methylase UbiE
MVVQAPGASKTVDNENDFARRIFSGLPRYFDELAEILAFGQNCRWRRATVDQVVTAKGAAILDVAPWTGGVALGLADRTQTSIIGIVLTESMVERRSFPFPTQPSTR